MTTAKKMFRPRRANSLNAIPRYIQEWFSGERKFCFHAFSYPYKAHLREYWKSWAQEHPGAVKPERLDYLISSAMTPEKIKKIKQAQKKGGNENV